MNRFRFKLEPLYEYRQRLEELSQKEFSETLRKLSEEEAKLLALKDLYSKSSEDMDKMREENAGNPELNLYYAYVTGLKKHIDEQSRIIIGVKAALEEKRLNLLSASRDKKVVEILKEKSYSSYMDKLNKEEQKISDDLVSSRFKRKTDE